MEVDVLPFYWTFVVLLINLSHVPLKPDARPQIKLREPLTQEE
jgi:hypothetical protein